MSAGVPPAVLFYLLDRHASLAMTRGSKCTFLNSLTTPGCAHPSNGGELGTFHRGIKFPSTEGWHEVPGWSLFPHPPSCSARHPPPEVVGILDRHSLYRIALLQRIARGPVGGGYYLHSILYTLHSNKKRGGTPFFILFRLLV